MLNRDDDNQIKITLLTLKEMNIGWCKSINAALIDYGLPNDYTQIKNMTVRQWTRLVSQRTEIMNYKRLFNDCHKVENGQQRAKTKTAHIIPSLTTNTYLRKPRDDIQLNPALTDPPPTKFRL